MLRLIIVPVDASNFGEQALPMAIRLAERHRAEIELLHVYEVLAPYAVQGAPPLDPALDEDLRNDRSAYLNRLADWVRENSRASVKATLLDGPVATTITEHVATRRADLAVMATHGRGGLSRLWLGSVAQEVVQNSSAPALLMRPDEHGSRATAARPFKHVLIPLDGAPLGEEAIDHALEVAGDPGVEFFLFHVLPPIVFIGEPTSLAFPDETELHEAAMSYLRDVGDQIRARGFSVDYRTIRHAQPARAILDAADDIGADLIAMETHGRKGLERLAMGSVADKVLHGATAPVLLHRPRVDAAVTAGEESRESHVRNSRR